MGSKHIALKNFLDLSNYLVNVGNSLLDKLSDVFGQIPSIIL